MFKVVIGNEMPNRTSQIGQTLKRWRQDAGLTQVAAGRIIGVDSVTVSRWERGKIGAIKTENAASMARAYGKPLPEVLRVLGIDAYATDYVTPRRVSERPVTGEESSFLVRQVREKATQFNIRRGQHAPEYELRQLRAELALAVRSALEPSAGNRDSIDIVVEAAVGLLTSESEPPRTAAVETPAAKSGTKHRR